LVKSPQQILTPRPKAAKSVERPSRLCKNRGSHGGAGTRRGEHCSNGSPLPFWEQAREWRKSSRIEKNGRCGSPSGPKIQARMRRLISKSPRQDPKPQRGEQRPLKTGAHTEAQGHRGEHCSNGSPLPFGCELRMDKILVNRKVERLALRSVSSPIQRHRAAPQTSSANGRRKIVA
jgi:hypothetical protein